MGLSTTGFSSIKVYAHNGYITLDTILHKPPEGISKDALDLWAIESYLREEVEKVVRGNDTTTRQKFGFFVEYTPETYLKESQ